MTRMYTATVSAKSECVPVSYSYACNYDSAYVKLGTPMHGSY